jgi:U4/U6 small nuclear ribonucleoprotein PRP31
MDPTQPARSPTEAALPLPQLSLAMSSLADELMNDLDSDSGGEEEQQPSAGPSNGAGAELATEVAMEDDGPEVEVTDEMVIPEGGVKPTLELDPESVDAMEMSSVAEVGRVAKLAGSKQMKEILTVRAAPAVRPVRL